jgi:hypothetical protein
MCSFIDKQCDHVFRHRQLMTGIRYYLSQFYGLIIKSFLIHYRRWFFTFILLLIPILHRLQSTITFSNPNDSGGFPMNIDSLNPQTILYHSDASIEEYLQASIHGAKLEKRSGDLSQMDDEV